MQEGKPFFFCCERIAVRSVLLLMEEGLLQKTKNTNSLPLEWVELLNINGM